MKAIGKGGVVAAVILMAAAAAMADGMIVPIRPDIRVRGSWAVKYHHVSIKVRDQVAAVSIDQEFVNTGRGMIEVEYLFPVPPGAAIDSMTLVVNGKEFAARLLDADKARKIYEDIVRRKKDPALLEYAGFGLYKTRAFPLEPGKPCKILVTYKNICKKDRSLVEVWYPLNTEKFSAKPIESVRVVADIKSAADIGPVYSPTHTLKVERKGPRHVIATYEEAKVLPTSDIQVFYREDNRKVGATLLTHQGDMNKDGYFMMLASPNPRVAARAVVPKDVVIVFDHSGSMSGEKIIQAKDALAYILKNLNSADRFNVVAYNDGVEPFFSSLEPAAPEKGKIARALDTLDRIEATGGTNIHDVLVTAVKLIPKDKARPGYVIFLTDGEPTIGNTNEKDILAHTKSANTAGARIFAFGVGYSPNVRLLDRLVNENNGRSDYVKPKEPIEAKVSSLYNKIKNPVMTALEVTLKGVRMRDMYPRSIGDLFDGDQLVVVGRYDAADVKKLPAREAGVFHTMLVIKGIYQGKERAFEYPVTIRPGGKDLRYVFVEKIWAVRRVGFLLDEIQLHGKSKEVIDELIRLSKRYGIMTPYTSFLADETTVLSSGRDVRRRADRMAKGLGGAVSGEVAQRAGKARQSLNRAASVPESSSAKMDKSGKVMDRVKMYGNSTRDAYESEKLQYVKGVRNVGNYSLYRRGQVWIASNASHIDLKKDADKITVIKRFSKEYFELTRLNTVFENQVMATQRDSEEMLLQLRGKVYHVK